VKLKRVGGAEEDHEILEDEDELNDLVFGDSVVSRLCFF